MFHLLGGRCRDIEGRALLLHQMRSMWNATETHFLPGAQRQLAQCEKVVAEVRRQLNDEVENCDRDVNKEHDVALSLNDTNHAAIDGSGASERNSISSSLIQAAATASASSNANGNVANATTFTEPIPANWLAEIRASNNAVAAAPLTGPCFVDDAFKGDSETDRRRSYISLLERQLALYVRSLFTAIEELPRKATYVQQGIDNDSLSINANSDIEWISIYSI